MMRIITMVMLLTSFSNYSYASDLSRNINKFGCTKYADSADYTEKCYVRIQVNVSDHIDWKRIACFGEINFKQVYKGEVKDLKEGFLISATQDVSLFRWPASFELLDFVYFPLGYGALDPKLSWSKCQVIVP